MFVLLIPQPEQGGGGGKILIREREGARQAIVSEKTFTEWTLQFIGYFFYILLIFFF